MPDRQYRDPAWDLGQAIVDRHDSTVDHDNYTQVGNLYRLFDDAHRDRLARRIAGVLGQARREAQLRQICHFARADEDYGRRVAGAGACCSRVTETRDRALLGHHGDGRAPGHDPNKEPGAPNTAPWTW
jgi:catalase